MTRSIPLSVLGVPLADPALARRLRELRMPDPRELRAGRDEDGFTRLLWVPSMVAKMLAYKAAERGMAFEAVPAEGLYLRCSRCGTVHETAPPDKDFACQSCGWRASADYNAARNMLTEATCSQPA